MSSNRLMPLETRLRTIEEVPSHTSVSFLKQVSDTHLDRLYDLPESIQDVMGLQALRPSAAVCKVMTVPNSNCVRIVTPDEHVGTGFHEILVYDMGQEEWPQVPLSEIGCLQLDWQKDLFAFVGRYQLELEQMRKACRDRFGPVASGTCPTCHKFIQVNLGKHVALYHLDLAQLWRCPVDCEPMPRNKPVADPILRERPVDGPMPRNRPDDVRACEPMPQIKPVDDPTLRERPVDEQMPRNRPDDVRTYEPMPRKKLRERPVDEQLSRNRLNDVPPYEPTPRERPVDDPKLRGWSVDVKAYEPMPRKKPVDVPTLSERPVDEQMSRNRLDDVPPYEPMTRERPVDDPTHKGRPVDDQGCELMTIARPVDVLVYEPTPRERPVDVPQLRGRPVDNQTYEPMKKGRPVKPKTVPVWCEPPPSADLPEWSESEVMPLIIIENSSVVNKPKTTDGLLPIGSDILLPQSPEVTSFEDQGSMSAPLSPNRVGKGHSQDIICQQKEVYSKCHRTYRDSICDRPGAVYR